MELIPLLMFVAVAALVGMLAVSIVMLVAADTGRVGHQNHGWGCWMK